MKISSLLAFTTLGAAVLLPKPAQARHDEAVAAIGGFIGGVIVGAHLDRDHHDRHDRYDRYDRHDRYDRRPAVIESCPPPPAIIIDRHPSRHRDGYWDYRTVKVWVPSQHSWSIDRYGRRVKLYQPGHYEYRRERVWVEDRRRGGRW